ncbi:MAG TPA: VOC family protein [Bacillota bacterium]|nr:VOC family protein [Bacillota bacterium]
MRVLNILPRVYVQDIDQAVPFYEGLFGVASQNRFSMPNVGLELASVGSLLIIAGTEVALDPFRSTQATFLVDDLDAFYNDLMVKGSTVIRPIQSVPTGRNMTVRHPDGTIVEYVEHHLG